MGLVTRQDVDVRMLGRGCPFTFEETNPRRISFPTVEMTAIGGKFDSIIETQ